MALIPKFPLQLLANGDFATVDEHSDAGAAELVSHLLLTRVGERQMVPAFGVPDPTFAALQHGDVVAGVELFGPDVDVVAVTSSDVGERTVEVLVELA